MSATDVLKRVGAVAGAVVGVAGAAYAGERAVVARMRRAPDGSSEGPHPLVVDEVRSVVGHDGVTLAVSTRGTGPPIVLLHGVVLGARLWAEQFESLPASGYRVVAYDARGHGESTVGESGHSLLNLATDLRSVLETLDLRGALLVGHSMGGMTVQTFVTSFPDVVAERVRGMVLLSTSPRFATSSAHRVRGAVGRVLSVAPDIGLVMRTPNLGFLVARAGFGKGAHPAFVEATREMIGACSAATVRDALRAMLTLDVTGELPDVDLPTLVLVGTEDALTSTRDADADRRARARRAPRGDPGRGPHAHVRARRRGRPARARLRA